MKKLMIMILMLFILAACSSEVAKDIDTTVCVVDVEDSNGSQYHSKSNIVFKSVEGKIISTSQIENIYNDFNWRGITDMAAGSLNVNGEEILDTLNNRNGFKYYYENIEEGRYVIVKEHDLIKVPLTSLSDEELSFLNLSDLSTRALHTNLKSRVDTIENYNEDGLLDYISSSCFTHE